MFSLSDLCVVEGKKVWKLTLDLVCLDYSGNVTDCALLAAIAALMDLKLPVTRINEEDGEVVMVKDELKPVALHYIPGKKR